MPSEDLPKGRRSAIWQEYLVTTVCHRRCPLFAASEHAEPFRQEIERTEADGDVEWLAWVVMPEHFHALLRLTGRRSLPGVMHLLKGRVAYRIGGVVWQKGYHDHALRNEEDRLEVVRYLLANPVRSGVTASLREYPYWHCRWLEPGDDPDELLRD